MSDLDSAGVATRVLWGTVSARAERVLIVAAGPSQRSLPMGAIASVAAAGVHVISVNAALAWAATSMMPASSWFTLDPDPRTLPLMREPYWRRESGPAVDFYAAVPEDYGDPNARVEYHRTEPPPEVTYLHRVAGDGPLSCRYGLSEDPAAIHTGNSAWGALGLAYLMGAQLIAFLGLDGTRSRYAYGSGRPGCLAHLPELFRSSLPQLNRHRVRVLNGSPASRITCFPCVTPEAALAWISNS